MRKFKIVYENCHHHYHILLLLSPTTHLTIQMEKFQIAKDFFFKLVFSRKPGFNFVALLQIWKIREKGSEKGCLRLFLSLSSDKSFNWAHIFKIPAFFLRSRKKIRSSNAAITFFLRFNVKIPAAPKKDLFLKNEDFFADIQLSRFWRENSLKSKNIYNISKCFASSYLLLLRSFSE